MLFCTICSIEIRFPNLSLFWHSSEYLADITDSTHLTPRSMLQHALISCHLPHQDGVSPRECMFSQLGWESLSPPSPPIHLSPVRSCPAASFPWRFHTTPKPKYIILSMASPYCLVRILRWSSTICPELQPVMLASPFLWKPPRGRNYAPLTHHHPRHKLLHRADATMLHWDFRTVVIVSTRSC